nr:hypothetical protein [bacterium]
MSWEDIIKVSENEVALTIDQLIEDATLLKIAIKAQVESVYAERFKNLNLAFKDVESDMLKLLE